MVLAANSNEAERTTKSLSKDEAPRGEVGRAARAANQLTPQTANGDKRLVIVGVNSKLPFILEEIEGHPGVPDAAPGCFREVVVVDNRAEGEFDDWYRKETGKNARPRWLSFKECYFRDETLVEAAIDFDQTGKIVLLADGHLLDERALADRIDADTFAKLLIIDHLIHDKNHRRGHHISLIVEMLTPETEVVVRNVRDCSHVVGQMVIGRFITTFTLYPELEKVFETMLRSGDVDIICQPLDQVKTGHGIPADVDPGFSQVLETRPANAIPIGWVGSNNPGGKPRPPGKTRLNPKAEEKSGEGERAIPPNAEIIYIYRHSPPPPTSVAGTTELTLCWSST